MTTSPTNEILYEKKWRKIEHFEFSKKRAKIEVFQTTSIFSRQHFTLKRRWGAPKCFLENERGLNFRGFEGQLPVTKYHYDRNENQKKIFENFEKMKLQILKIQDFFFKSKSRQQNNRRFGGSKFFGEVLRYVNPSKKILKKIEIFLT